MRFFAALAESLLGVVTALTDGLDALDRRRVGGAPRAGPAAALDTAGGLTQARVAQFVEPVVEQHGAHPSSAAATPGGAYHHQAPMLIAPPAWAQ